MKLELSKQKVTELTKCDKQHYSGLYCLCCHFVLEKNRLGNYFCKGCGAKLGILR